MRILIILGLLTLPLWPMQTKCYFDSKGRMICCDQYGLCT